MTELTDCPELTTLLLPAVTEVIANELSDSEALVCNRVWEAWSYGTMSDDDFENASETDLPDEVAKAVLKVVFEKLETIGASK